MAPARALDPVLDGLMELPYPVWNSAFDELYAAGDQWYWRGDFVKEIPDEAVAVHAEWGPRLPTWKSTMHLYPVDGAVHDVGPDETAFAYRDAVWSAVIAGVDLDPENFFHLNQNIQPASSAVPEQRRDDVRRAPTD